MMKTLFIDCGMGAAGDMLSAALLELVPDPGKTIAALNAIGIPGVEFVREKVSRCGIAATHLSVLVHGEEEASDHHHHHHHHDGHGEHEAHHHHHHHHHRSLAEALAIIDSLRLPDRVGDAARSVYRLIAEAEAKAHSTTADAVHFHEVGSLDAIADVVAFSCLHDLLAPSRTIVSPVHVGFGTVRCAHGLLPVPAPCTANLLEGVPSYSDGMVEGELCTPTGAALVRHFADGFGRMPMMRVLGVGNGAGRREFEGRANIVRAMLGEEMATDSNESAEGDIWRIECNIDDMTGEDMAFASSRVLDAGAVDVSLVPALMKKGRPGTIFVALCRDERHDEVVAAMLRHTTTLGVRETRMRRTVLDRGTSSVGTAFGPVRVKTAEGYGMSRSKPEFEDVAAAAMRSGLPLADVRAAVSNAMGSSADGMTWPVLREYRGEKLRRVRMPLGGIGTGVVLLSGCGGMRGFEIRNRADTEHIPSRDAIHPAFVVRTEDADGKVCARLLEGPIDKTLYEGAFGCPAPNHGYPRFSSCVFKAAYPLAQVVLSDPSVPLVATLEAMNPLVQGDEEASGMPVALLRWRVVNTSGRPLKVTIAAAMPNPCGGDVSQEEALSQSLRGVVFHGNADKPDTDKPLCRDTGEFALSVPADAGVVSVAAKSRHAGWSDGLDQFWRRLVSNGDVVNGEGARECRFGTIAVAIELRPGESKAVPFAYSWRFPNRTQWEWCENGMYERINHVGNHYCETWPTALSAAEALFARLDELEAKTVEFVRSVTDAAGVPDAVKEAALFNISTLRSPTCFRTADGHFFGWEGVGDTFGSCYGNCTHVWGYEHALVDIWPNLAKDMRDLEFRHAMTDEGAIAFRIGQPIDRNSRMHGGAAADGQMQCIVKACECWLKTGDDAWMEGLYPFVRKAMEFCWVKGGWDADQDGVMEGCQHNTMDVNYFGPNPQMEFLYLAALEAMERLAERFDADKSFAAKCAALRKGGSAWTEANLFNGDYYEHKVMPSDREFHPWTTVKGTEYADPKNPDFQLGPGCLIDQLVGDYAARAVGLEPVADFAHARKATDTILRRNRREADVQLFNHMRDFTLFGERSLVMAWYPPDRRPKTPFPYYPETMTGFEYVVAAWLAQTGDFAAAEMVVRDIRDRYDGEKRNPFDEAECGRHYARALASWSVFKAWRKG